MSRTPVALVEGGLCCQDTSAWIKSGAHRWSIIREYGEHPIVPAILGRYAAGMNSPFRHVLLALLAIVCFALATAGCQTAHGFGKDVEKLGDKIQDKSN